MRSHKFFYLWKRKRHLYSANFTFTGWLSKSNTFLNLHNAASYKVKIDSHNLLGKTKRDTNIDEEYLEEEDRIFVSGFMMIPVDIITKLDESIYNL